MVDSAKRPGDADPWGRLTVICGGTSPLKDLAISKKPGSGIHFCVMGLPGGVFTHWVKIFGASDSWHRAVSLLAIVGLMSFECPMPFVLAL